MPTSKATVHSSAGAAAPGHSAERDLVDRCRRGELGAFEELYRAHSGRLFSLAVRMLGNPADAEDQLQEIFLSAHRKLQSFRGESALATWLYRLAMNQILASARRPLPRLSLWHLPCFMTLEAGSPDIIGYTGWSETAVD